MGLAITVVLRVDLIAYKLCIGTPLWRNGPPEKPVLCNACGSRWRTKGTLANYTPLHARADPDDFEDTPRFSNKVKTIFIKNKEPKALKRKLDNHHHNNNNDVNEFGFVPPEHDFGFRKVFDEDTSNRSSSGSAISNSESCAQYGSADASDLTGPAQASAWDSIVPSRKRTCVARSKPSPVEKLTKDLYTLWHEQQSSCFSGSSEEDLLLESHEPMVSVEIGHGSVLIRHPSSIAREEESEASSLSFENKQHNLNSWQMSFNGLVEETGANSLNVGKERIKKHQAAVEEQTRRDKDQHAKFPILAHHNSPLCYIDLQEIVNIDVFSSLLTKDEQQQLMKFMPSVDTLDAPFSLKSMFSSAELNVNLSSFQKLLTEGVFDNSSHMFNTEDCKVLRKLILCDFTKSKWVEQYTKFKDLKSKNSIKPEMKRGYNNGFETVDSANFKRARVGPYQKIAGSKVMMKSPRRIIMKSSYDDKQVTDKECFTSGKSPLSMQNDNSSFMLDSCHFDGDSFDQDLLVNVPSNGTFPQAELLPSSSFGAMASTSSSSVYPNLLRH